MNRTITVRGTGTLQLRPDWTEISITLKSMDRNYSKSAEKAATQLSILREALANAGFNEAALKTASFAVNAEHEGRQDKDGQYRNVFVGYACIQALKLEFPLDTGRLSAAIEAITGCLADPELDVHFTLHDKEAASDALLTSAAKNARKKAETLAMAAGVTLGELVSIEYAHSTPEYESSTELRMAKQSALLGDAMNLTFQPEYVETSDSAVFIWEIR